MLPNTATSQTVNGVDFTVNSDGTVTANGTATAGINFNIANNVVIPAGTYKFSDGITNASQTTYFTFIDGPSMSTANPSTTVKTFTEETTLTTIRIVIREGQTLNNIIFKPKLEPGTKATPYSTYGMGSISEKIVNKNWFDKDNIDWYRNNDSAFDNKTNNNSTRIRSTSLDIEGGKTYIVSGYPSSVTLVAVRSYDNNQSLIENGVTRTGNTLIITDKIKYIHLLFGGENFTDETNIMMKNANIQIEEGSIATPYIAHQEQNHTIYTQQPMRSIGDVRDGFVKVNGNWFERHMIYRAIFDGTESFGKSGNNSNNSFYYSSDSENYKFPFANKNTICNNTGDDTKTPDALCNYLKVKPAYFIVRTDTIGLTLDYKETVDLEIRFGFGLSSSLNTIEKLKAWIAEKYASGNPVYVDYILEEPLDLPCTEEQVRQLEAYQKARTYKNVSHFYSEDEVEPYEEVVYVRDLETVINNLS